MSMTQPEIPEPAPGAPVTADWARRIARALRSMRIVGGPGIKVSTTPSGTTVSVPPPKRAEKEIPDAASKKPVTRSIGRSEESGHEGELQLHGFSNAGGAEDETSDKVLVRRVVRGVPTLVYEDGVPGAPTIDADNDRCIVAFRFNSPYIEVRYGTLAVVNGAIAIVPDDDWTQAIQAVEESY